MGDKPSLGMFLMRWKKEHLRLATISALFSFVLIAVCLLALYGAPKKNITLVVNGERHTMITAKSDVRQLLEQQNLSLGPFDRINVSLDAKLTRGKHIIVDQAIPVQVLADGILRSRHTTGRTVAAALNDLNLALGPDDKVYPSLHEKLTGDETIRVVRVKTVIEQQEQEIPFQTVNQEDPELLRGKQQIVQQGVNGLQMKKVQKVYENEVLASVKVLETSVEKESVAQVIAMGTKKPVEVLTASSPAVQKVSKQGITFEAKQILNNVVLTAYDAGPGSTGKTEDNPQYGMTYSGTKVMEGRTIAVDPRVIPLGWWVYIEGYGFRRAEDIGSGVKGKWIDLYVQDPEVANHFGLKRGATVYVIGPNKPVTN